MIVAEEFSLFASSDLKSKPPDQSNPHQRSIDGGLCVLNGMVDNSLECNATFLWGKVIGVQLGPTMQYTVCSLSLSLSVATGHSLMGTA